MDIKQATELLGKCTGDSESYHYQFDDIIEERLGELDPEFMKAMTEEYEKSGESRWFA